MLDKSFMYLAALLIAWGAVCYIRDMYRSGTRPNLVTWFLWTLAPLIAFTAQIRAGVGAEAFLTLMVALCPLAVFVAGLRMGYFSPSRFDLLCGAISVCALVLWQITGSGAVGIAFSILADGLAATPTLAKAYKDPRSESWFLFLLFAIGAAITLLTLDSWSIETSAFSLYILALYVVLFVFVRFEPGMKFMQPDKELLP